MWAGHSCAVTLAFLLLSILCEVRFWMLFCNLLIYDMGDERKSGEGWELGLGKNNWWVNRKSSSHQMTVSEWVSTRKHTLANWLFLQRFCHANLIWEDILKDLLEFKLVT
jgi:hypothetical protein